MGKQIDLFQGFALPKSNTEEVLLTLITQGYTSFFDFQYMQGFRTRVSNLVLNYGLNLETTKHQKQNKFGNTYHYALHRLPETEREKAIELYNKLNLKKPLER